MTKATTISKYSLVMIIIWLFVLQSCDTENSLGPDDRDYYIRFFGDEGLQEGVDLIVNEEDQSILLLGTTTDPSSSTKRIFLVKANWEGNVIWKRKLGGPYDIAKDIERSNDGGFIILSESSPDVQLSEGLGIKLITISQDGNKADSAVFNSPLENGVSPNDYPAAVTPIANGYIVTGSSQYGTQWANGGDEDLSDVLRIFFDNNLEIDPLDYPYYSLSGTDYGVNTIQLDQDYYTFTSSRYSPNTPANDYNFNCYALNGQGFSMGEFAANNDEFLNAICPSFTSGYFMAGTHMNGGVSEIYIGYSIVDGGALIKASEGKIITIPQSSGRKIETSSVCQAKANPQGYLILGTEGDVGSRNIWLTKVSDIGGQVYWSSIFGASDRNDDRAGAVAELPDGRILVVGTVNLGVNNLKMSLFKLNSEGRFAN